MGKDKRPTTEPHTIGFNIQVPEPPLGPEVQRLEILKVLAESLKSMVEVVSHTTPTVNVSLQDCSVILPSSVPSTATKRKK
jgi:hypothetical protein